jgi:SET domain-containing protein
MIPAGSFVCEYTGEILLDTDAEATGLARDDSYLFNLDGEQKGKVNKRKRTGAAVNSASARTEANPELCVDASRTGSVARFLNHCCEPNLFVQSVFVEYSRHVHRIAIFAARDILPYEELTYDYGYVVGSVKDKTLKCLCGAATCRGFLF